MKKCIGNKTHYSVSSPEITTYEYFEWGQGNPETYSCWTETLATNAKEAVALAVKMADFKEWVTEARSDGINPYKGVKAQRFVCEHGTCLGCNDECDACIASTELPETLPTPTSSGKSED